MSNVRIKSREDYLKEIAEQINNAKVFENDNPTIKDIENLHGFEYIIINEGVFFPVIIRRKYEIMSVLGIPTVMWSGGFEIGDSALGMIPAEYTAEECLDELKGYKGEIQEVE